MEVGTMLSKVGKWLDLNLDDEKLVLPVEEKEIELTDEQKIQEMFKYIYGHDKLKKLFYMALHADDPVHIILKGSPGTAKTLFLEAIEENVEDTTFITSNATGPGLLHHIYDDPDMKYLCIDEIEKIPRTEIGVLLTLMESGRLIITKKTMMVNRKQKLRIFATCNDVNKLSPEMQSRFLKLHLNEYTYPEFHMVAKNLVCGKFKKSEALADKIADVIWNKVESRDIRDVIKVARLTKDPNEVDFVLDTLEQYKEHE